MSWFAVPVNTSSLTTGQFTGEASGWALTFARGQGHGAAEKYPFAERKRREPPGAVKWEGDGAVTVAPGTQPRGPRTSRPGRRLCGSVSPGPGEAGEGQAKGTGACLASPRWSVLCCQTAGIPQLL